jgi:predicted nucleotide-binding protein
MIDKAVIRNILEKNGYDIKFEGACKKNAYKFKTQMGTSVFINQKGKYWCQGKAKKPIDNLLKELLPKSEFNKKIFVVYGRDSNIITELKAVLSVMDLELVLISEVNTFCETIIEKLERTINECNYGIILATPDDVGYLNGYPQNMKMRMRQNVVFEIGMLFANLGRRKTMLIMRNADQIEIPSDIEGINRTEFKEHISEISERIIQELESVGYEKR